MRKSAGMRVIVSAMAAVLALVGCNSQPTEKTDETPVVENATIEEEGTEEVVKDVAEEPETKMASVGDPIAYHANAGGDFIITVDGFERSQESTDWALQFGDIAENQCEAYLMLTVENQGVDISANNWLVQLGRVWLEDADGVTVNPANEGFSYGEYGNACDFIFEIHDGQTVKIAVPFQLPEGETEYELVVEDSRVPLTLTEGSRPVS